MSLRIVACIVACSTAVLCAAVPATATPGGGAQLWVARWSTGTRGTNTPRHVAVSPDGSSVFVVGDSATPSQVYPDFATVAYDAGTGTQLWAKRLGDGPGESLDQVHDDAVSPDGERVYVTGNLGEAAGTVAYAADTGRLLWKRQFFGPLSPTWASALAVNPRSTLVYVTGWVTADGFGDGDYLILAYDGVTGAPVWKRTYDGPRHSGDYANDVVVSHDGQTVYITGGSIRVGFECATVAYDAATGRTRWVRRIGARARTGECLGVDVSPDDNMVFVSGDGSHRDGDSDYVTVAMTAGNGTVRWLSRYESPGNGEDWVLDNVVSRSGSSVFVTGSSDATDGGTEYATVAYDTRTGAQSWVRREGGSWSGGQDGPSAISISPLTDDVYVTGSIETGSITYEFGTFAYTPEGAVAWSAVYENPVGGEADGLAVASSPSALSVFVAGPLNGDYRVDFGTIAYSA
jgi:hypothetical protein